MAGLKFQVPSGIFVWFRFAMSCDCPDLCCAVMFDMGQVLDGSAWLRCDVDSGVCRLPGFNVLQVTLVASLQAQDRSNRLRFKGSGPNRLR